MFSPDELALRKLKAEIITAITKGDFLTINNIRGLRERLATQQGTKSGGYVHGGGDTVEAGTNITIVKLSSGRKRISAPTAVGIWHTPPETPDGTITVYTVGASAPTDVVADGATLFQGQGYTFAAGQITLVNPPVYYVRYR